MFRSLLLTALAVFMAVILTLTGLRFLALLADANRDSELVQRLYDWSEFWVEPFFNILGLQNEAVEGGGTFEPASLVAFVVYLLIGAFVGAVLSGAFFSRGHAHG